MVGDDLHKVSWPFHDTTLEANYKKGNCWNMRRSTLIQTMRMLKRRILSTSKQFSGNMSYCKGNKWSPLVKPTGIKGTYKLQPSVCDTTYPICGSSVLEWCLCCAFDLNLLICEWFPCCNDPRPCVPSMGIEYALRSNIWICTLRFKLSKLNCGFIIIIIITISLDPWLHIKDLQNPMTLIDCANVA